VSRISGLAARTVIAWLVWQRAASAGTSRVVILHESSPDGVDARVEMRLAAELRAAGFEVDERASDGADDARRAVEQATEGGPFAAVLLHRAIGGSFTDIWVADHATRKTVVRRVEAGGVGDRADRALALRVVELMRASLLEGLVLSPGDLSTPGSPPAAPASDVVAWTRAAVKETADRPLPFEIGMGIAGVSGGPQLGIAVAPELRIGWRAHSLASVAVLAAGPAFGARVTASEGSAAIRQELVIAEVAVEPWPRGPLRPYVAAGGGFYHLAAMGYAAPPYTSGGDELWSALVAAGFGARIPLTAATSLVLDARELFALPRPVMAFAGQEVAVSMRPGTAVTMTLSVGLR
jgi:hypothetical protein